MEMNNILFETFLFMLDALVEKITKEIKIKY